MNTAFLGKQSYWSTVWIETTVGTGRRPASDTPLLVEAKASTLRSVAFGLFCLLIFAIPWENAFVFQGIGTISRLLGLVALPAGVLAILASGRLRRASTPLVLMGLFVAWGGLSYVWTADSETTTILMTSWVQNLGMVWLIWELADHRDKQLMLMRAYVLGTLVSAGDTLWSYLQRKEVYYQRYAGLGFDPNDLGLLLALSLPLSFYLATIERHKRLVWAYRLQQVVAILAIGLTSSRAALIATAVALAYLPLASVKMTTREKCAFLLLVLIASGSMLAVLPESSWQRWGEIGKELEQGTWGSRKIIWLVGLEIFRDHPIRGVGAGSFSAATQRVLATPEVAHNTFLSILVEEGLLGFGLFLLLLLSLALLALRLPALERSLWLIALATWATGVFTLTWENRKPTWFLFGLLASWLASRNSSPAGSSNAAFPGGPAVRFSYTLGKVMTEPKS